MSEEQRQIIFLHVDWGKTEVSAGFQSANQMVQSAKTSDELPSKCKICTLEH